MYASGKTMTQIAETLKIDVSTVSRDIDLMREKAKEKQERYIEKELPFRHQVRTSAMDRALKELWAIFEKESSMRGKKAILDSITDGLIKQAALDGDPLAISEAIKAVASVRKVRSTASRAKSKSIEGEDDD